MRKLSPQAKRKKVVSLLDSIVAEATKHLKKWKDNKENPSTSTKKVLSGEQVCQ
jgi:hypothetical protein